MNTHALPSDLPLRPEIQHGAQQTLVFVKCLLTVAPLSVLLPWIPRTSWASHDFFNAPTWSTSYQGIVPTGLTEGFINRLTACVVANTHELAEIINSFLCFGKTLHLNFTEFCEMSNQLPPQTKSRRTYCT